MPLARPFALILSVATLAFAAAGCGGGSSSSSSSGTKPETWASSVCGSLQTWANDLRSGSQSLSADLKNSSDLKSVKQKLVAFLESAKASTDKMVDEVKAAGAPAIKDGQTFQNDLVQGLGAARDSFQHAVTKAKDLPTGNPRTFVAGVTALGQQIQTELTTAGKHFDDLKTKYKASSLDEAVSKEPACKPFVSSG